MPSLQQEKIVNHSAHQMYELVMDIERYPEFLPWCKKAEIVKRVSDENLEADLLINFKNLFEKYRSDVKYGQMEDGSYYVDVVAIKGPFKSLTNRWKITPIAADKCLINFFLEFEFNSSFLTKMIGLIFEKAAEKMMMAFEDRAKQGLRA